MSDGMDFYLRRVHKEVSRYDSLLYAVRHGSQVQIYRQGYSLKDRMLPLELEDHVGRPNPQFILALTDDWTLKGQPVNWGLECIMTKLKSMDSWRRGDDVYKTMLEHRERAERDEQRIKRNEIRDIAKDARRDFAKATDGINTGTMDKSDPRRRMEG